MTQRLSMSQPSRRAPRRTSLRFLVTVLLTTTMVATGGFGTLPDNPITQAVQEEIGRNFPPAILDPINSYLDELSVPTIAPQPASEPNRPLDLIGLFLNEPITETAVPVVDTPSPTFTVTNTPDLTTTATLTATATSTSTPSPTSSVTPTLTATPVCSRPSTTPATTTFFNNSALTIEIYLVDPACKLVLISVLGSGQSTVQETFIGQLWWFVDSASTRLLADYVVSLANETVDVSTGAIIPTTTSTAGTPNPFCSTPSEEFVTLYFYNGSTSRSIDIYWVDFSCNLIYYSTLGPQEGVEQESYVGHRWRFVDSLQNLPVGDYVVYGPDEVDVSSP